MRLLDLTLGRVVEDALTALDAAADPIAAIGAGSVIVPATRWTELRDRVGATPAGPIGVRLGADRPDLVDRLVRDLDRLALIAVVFESFRDGRGFSIARTLRERHGYPGRLRAQGWLLPDQFRFLARCGFDQIAPSDPGRLDEWRAHLDRFSVRYQATAADLHLKPAGQEPSYAI